MSILSIQPSNNNAIVLPDAPPDINKRKTKASKISPRKSTVHVQASSANAIILPGCGAALPYTSSAQAMAAAQSQGGHLDGYDRHRAYAGLPDGFPDNASQVSAWQKRRVSGKIMGDQGTVLSVRPRNDRRTDVARLARVPE